MKETLDEQSRLGLITFGPRKYGDSNSSNGYKQDVYGWPVISINNLCKVLELEYG